MDLHLHQSINQTLTIELKMVNLGLIIHTNFDEKHFLLNC